MGLALRFGNLCPVSFRDSYLLSRRGSLCRCRTSRTVTHRNSEVRDPIGLLIYEARAGSAAALGQLFEGCRRYLLLLANGELDSQLRPKAGASDLVQETFCEAQHAFKDFRGSTPSEFFAWLKGILDNRLSNHIRHYATRMRDVRREVPLDVDSDPELMEVYDPDVTPAALEAMRDEEARLHKAIARLGESQRRVIVRHTWERASFAEIGAEMNITAEAARKHWARGLRRLQEELERFDG